MTSAALAMWTLAAFIVLYFVFFTGPIGAILRGALRDALDRKRPLRARAWALSGPLLLLGTGVALAGAAMSENYAEIRKPAGTAPTFTSAFAALDGTDSTTWGDALAGRTLPTNGDPTLEVTVRHSAEGATACVMVGHRARDGSFQGIAGVQTSTAVGGNASGRDASGWYGAEKLYFPLTGWYGAEIRVVDASGSTTVDLKPVTIGATGRAAE